MTPEERKYILENAKKLTAKQFAERLHLKERTVARFLERRQIQSSPPQPGPSQDSRSSLLSPFFLLTCLAAFGIGFLSYSNSFQASFHFDDDRSILHNYAIRNLSDLKSIWMFSRSRFLTYLSLALNYHFTGLDLFSLHLTNLLIHLLTSLAVYRLIHLTFQTPGLQDNPLKKHSPALACAASLIFLAHPIQTQAVTYIIQRTASLAGLFYISSVACYAQARLTQGRLAYLASILSAVAAMFTKEISFTLPLMLVIYEAVFFPNFFKELSRRIAKLLPFLGLLAVVPGIFIFQYGLDSDSVAALTQETKAISRGHYLLTQINVIRTYLRLLVLPVKQHLDYAYPISRNLFEPKTLLSLLLHLGWIGFAVKIFKRHRFLSFGIFWFFAALSVESSIIPIRDVIFEHRLYLPMAGFSMIFSYGFYALARDSKKFWAILIPAIFVFSFLTYNRNRAWKDEISLWTDSMKKSPAGERPYHNLAIAYHQKGEEDKALEYYEKALALNPKISKAYNAIGAILARRKQTQKAIEYFEKSIQADPDAFEGYANLGTLYLFLHHNYESAIKNHTLAIQKDPDGLKRNSWKSFYEIGLAQFLSGNKEKAEESVETLKRIGRKDLAEKLERILKGEEDPFSPVNPKMPAGGIEVMNVQ